MTAINKFFKWLYEIADDVLAYVLTVLGIVFSEVLPQMKDLANFHYNASFWKLSGTLVIALLINLWQETLEQDDSGSKMLSRDARKKRFSKRMFNSLLYGFCSAQIIDTILKSMGV